MQAMPSKNLALPATPLSMPYIQRRPELEGDARPFKLVSDYTPAGDQPEAIKQLIAGVEASGGDGRAKPAIELRVNRGAVPRVDGNERPGCHLS